MLTFLQVKLEFDKERLRQEQERKRDRPDNALNQQQMLDRQMQNFQLVGTTTTTTIHGYDEIYE